MRPKERDRGAGSRNRTHDQRFTKPLLYQLSYAGLSRDFTRAEAAASGNRSLNATAAAARSTKKTERAQKPSRSSHLVAYTNDERSA
jgi:hypothetical protein